MLLVDAQPNKMYKVVSIALASETQRYLSTLGVNVGTWLKVIAQTQTGAVLMLKGSRLALDRSLLGFIDVIEEVSSSGLPLSEVQVGEVVYVQDIFALGEAKRRLMDMGLTRHTKVYLRKVAPLGDPIEISLRGYELTLRKSEAQLIRVVKGDSEEKK